MGGKGFGGIAILRGQVGAEVVAEGGEEQERTAIGKIGPAEAMHAEAVDCQRAVLDDGFGQLQLSQREVDFGGGVADDVVLGGGSCEAGRQGKADCD